MPKKRFSSQYSKPQSTVHPSLATSASLSIRSDAPPSVNELISSARKSNVIKSVPAATTNTSHTLPPQIRSLLSQPETPVPRARARRLRDADGRRLPPGPAPPTSWLQSRNDSSSEMRSKQNAYPIDVDHLPGIQRGNSSSLLEMCLRIIARNWETLHEYEMHNLVDLPTRLRMLLLSEIAVYGPDEGVGYEGLQNLIIRPSIEDLDDTDSPAGIASVFNSYTHDEDFYRLDLSGAIGNSVSFKQLAELVQKPETPPASENEELSWEETLTISQSLSATIPKLTHLSLSHPSSSISWPRLLAFTKNVPTLTHLSLAYWPVPSLTPNATTAVMQNKFGQDVQYGGTNFYSHTLDNDFREAAGILRRLATRLYGLQYLDLSGCTHWLQALRWTGESEVDRGIDWSSQWTQMTTLKVLSGHELDGESEYVDVVSFVQSYKEALATEDMLRWWMRRSKALGQRKHWIDVVKDDWMAYGELWIGSMSGDSEELKKKRTLLDSLKSRGEDGEEKWRSPVTWGNEVMTEAMVERLSVWDQ